VKHDIIQEKLHDIQLEKEREKQQLILKAEQRQLSLLGHVEGLDNQSLFIITLSFLEPKDLFKLISLNKDGRGHFLGNRASYQEFRKIFVGKIEEQTREIKEKQLTIQAHEKSLKFLNE